MRGAWRPIPVRPRLGQEGRPTSARCRRSSARCLSSAGIGISAAAEGRDASAIRRSFASGATPGNLVAGPLGDSVSALTSVNRSSAATAVSVCSALSATLRTSSASWSRSSARNLVALSPLPTHRRQRLRIAQQVDDGTADVWIRTVASHEHELFVLPSATSCCAASSACARSSAQPPALRDRERPLRERRRPGLFSPLQQEPAASTRVTAARRTRASASSRASAWSVSVSSGPISYTAAARTAGSVCFHRG